MAVLRPLARARIAAAVRARGALSLRTEPRYAAMAMAERRHRRGGRAVAGRFVAAVVVSVEFRGLQRDLWLARRGDRSDDLDVDVGHHRALWSGAEFRDRTPDDRRLNGGPTEAARGSWRQNGRHSWQGDMRMWLEDPRRRRS